VSESTLTELQRNKIAIIGAGPTGLGAAFRLTELGLSNFTVFEASDHAGGLASSFRDEAGFTWDIGGHVQFSHYKYFDTLMNRLLGDEWLFHERESWVWICDRFVPYPFQNNIHSLPEEEKRKCLRGLIQLKKNGAPPPANFGEWIRASFGDGIAQLFLLPYNFKVWAYPPEELSYTWVGERVASVDLERVVFNMLDNRADVAWGPNNQFQFPLRGGTGEIWRRLAALLPAGSLQFGKKLVGVDTAQKRLRFLDGSAEPYDTLISTMPLDTLIGRSDLEALKPAAETLKFSTVHVVGVGLRGSPPPHLKTKCWMYFPEATSPFYRATVFSNYSPNNVPDISRHWSLMMEVSESPSKPVDRERLIDSVVDGLVATGLISNKSEVCSTWHYIAGHGYPTPFLSRDKVVNPLFTALEERDIFSRGRFGAWKYEVSNQDHSLMQGVELINRLAFSTPEMTLNHPAIVNGAKQ